MGEDDPQSRGRGRQAPGPRPNLLRRRGRCSKAARSAVASWPARKSVRPPPAALPAMAATAPTTSRALPQRSLQWHCRCRLLPAASPNQRRWRFRRRRHPLWTSHPASTAAGVRGARRVASSGPAGVPHSSRWPSDPPARRRYQLPLPRTTTTTTTTRMPRKPPPRRRRHLRQRWCRRHPKLPTAAWCTCAELPVSACRPGA